MIMGGGPKALKGVFLPTLISGLALSVPELLINMAMGPELSVIVPSAIIMGSIVVCAKIFKTDDRNTASKLKFVRFLPAKVSARPCRLS